MPRGGKRAGAGRKKGSPPPQHKPLRRLEIIACESMPEATPPHEVLAAIARGCKMTARFFDEATGEPIGDPFDTYPTMDQRLRAATEAAPYFAARLVSVQPGGSPEGLDASEYSDEELAAIAAGPPSAQTTADTGGSGGGAAAPAGGAAKPQRLGKRRPA